MIIREEAPGDAASIRQVTETAFGQDEEADLVDMLRASGDAVISLVAELDGKIAGHVLLSKLQAPERGLALAPVSVTPAHQAQGVGSQLIREGLARAKDDGWQAVFVVGEPAYYERFGFRAAVAEKFETSYPQPYVMALELVPHSLDDTAGPLVYAPAFEVFE